MEAMCVISLADAVLDRTLGTVSLPWDSFPFENFDSFGSEVVARGMLSKRANNPIHVMAVQMALLRGAGTMAQEFNRTMAQFRG